MTSTGGRFATGLDWNTDCPSPVMSTVRRHHEHVLILRRSICISALFVFGVAFSHQSWSQQVDAELPPVKELLDRACEQIDLVDQGLSQAYLYRQAAVLYARAGEAEGAYTALKRIQIPQPTHPQTRKNLMRVGFLEIVEEVALHVSTDTAIKLVDERPRTYQGYADDAFGHIAISASRRGDANGAWSAISRIREPKGLYPYELVVARTLDDKIRGKSWLLNEHKQSVASLDGRKHLAREEWAGILWMLSLFEWCGMTKEFEELIARACATQNEPEKARAEMLRHLKEEFAPEDSADDAATEKRVSVADIRRLNATMSDLHGPRDRAERLLKVAKMVLDFDRPPLPASDD